MKQNSLRVLASLEQDIAYHTGCTLRGISCNKKEDGWLVVLKVKNAKEANLVAFVHANTIDLAFEMIASALYTKAITLTWRDDKFS